MSGFSQLAKAIPIVAAGSLLLSSFAGAETRTTLEQQTAVAVTIYNQNLALVSRGWRFGG